MIQGAVEVGQFPKPQVVLPGDLVEILIAHDVVGLGLAHHGDRGRVHSRALGEAVGERPGRPRRGFRPESAIPAGKEREILQIIDIIDILSKTVR